MTRRVEDATWFAAEVQIAGTLGWVEMAAIERFLRERIRSPRGGLVQSLSVRDEEGDLRADSLAAARRRIQEEGTTLARLTLHVQDANRWEDVTLHAYLDVCCTPGVDVVRRHVIIRGTDDRRVRDLRRILAQQIERWSETGYPPMDTTSEDAAFETRPRSAVLPDWRAVRDNLVSSAIWVVLTVVAASLLAELLR